MTREQRQRVETWVRWALALALLPTVAALDGRYVHQAEYQSDHALLLRIDSTTKSTAGRVSKMFCASLPAEKRGGCE